MQENVALSEAPTAVLRKPPSMEMSSRQAARQAEDPEQTVPLSRTSSGHIMGSTGARLALCISPDSRDMHHMLHAQQEAINRAVKGSFQWHAHALKLGNGLERYRG